MPKKSLGLGRGLDSLFSAPEEWGESVRQIPIGDLDPNPDQPRKSFDPGLIDDLAESIRQNGVLTPLLVVPSFGGRYTIIAGERRFRAARQADLDTLPCLVREHWSETEQAEAALVENLQREDLNAIEEARGVQALITNHRYTHEDAGRVIGRHRTSVTNLLRLLELPDEVIDMVQDGRISAGHARALLGLKDDGADEKGKQSGAGADGPGPADRRGGAQRPENGKPRRGNEKGRGAKAAPAEKGTAHGAGNPAGKAADENRHEERTEGNGQPGQHHAEIQLPGRAGAAERSAGSGGRIKKTWSCT